MANLIRIDGSLGEGGGQVLRIALSLSAIFKIPFEIDNIRIGRAKPGLAAQHLKGVELAKELYSAQVTGAEIGSTKLVFKPRDFQQQNTNILVDTRTAGCITLLAQVGLPCALFAPTSNTINLILKGGTNVPMGPQVEYLTEILKPTLNKFGADFDFDVVRRGYYPKGGGEVHLRVKPINSLNPVQMMEPGEPESIIGWSFVAGAVHINEAYKMANDAKRTITETLLKNEIYQRLPPMDIMSYKESPDMAFGHASGISLMCKTNTGCIFGGSGLGSKRDRNQPGIDAAKELLNPLLSRSCVDEHLQDQLVIFMALAKGTSKVLLGNQELTSHTDTAIKVAEIMLADRGVKFNLSRLNGNTGPYILECNGCGFTNKFVKRDEL